MLRQTSILCRFLASSLGAACLFGACGTSRDRGVPWKVHVMPGLHMSFYHSWRGDAPDASGFGTDIRVVRGVLDQLDEAEAQGLDARVYWDFTVHWTLERYLPEHAPEIVDRIRDRVRRGLDEVVAGPYNNGVTSAQTEDEFLASVQWALENPFGSGLRQVFGQVTPLFRPQEGFFTPGQIELLERCGIQGVILLYSNAPFTAFSTFVPVLPPRERFNPLWVRTAPGADRFLLLPCVSHLDLVNHVSLENLLLWLRRMQETGAVRDDLLVHINFDADAETWVPLTPGIPNLGGLREFIHAVNKYPWARFTTPAEYLADHPPRGEVLLRRDLADGAFDGYSSWAEKASSLEIWTDLEASRYISAQADALDRGQDPEVGRNLWEGTGSSFFQRLLGLSATHFGMATPLVQEQRLMEGRRIAGRARRAAEEQRDRAGRRALGDRVPAPAGAPEADYVFTVFDYGRGRNEPPLTGAVIPVRVPLLLSGPGRVPVLWDDRGRRVPCSLVDLEPVEGGHYAGSLLLPVSLSGTDTGRTFFLSLTSAPAAPAAGRPPPLAELENPWIRVQLDERTGIRSIAFQGEEIGDASFLDPFVTYRQAGQPRERRPGGFRFLPLEEETWDGLERACLGAMIPLWEGVDAARVEIRYTFTLPDDLPFLLADVEVRYPFTRSRDRMGKFQ